MILLDFFISVIVRMKLLHLRNIGFVKIGFCERVSRFLG